MLRQLITAAVAVTLLAGCSGGDDKPGSASDGDPSSSASSTASTPSGSAAGSFDPPKAFVATGAEGEPEEAELTKYDIESGIVGQAAVYATTEAVSGTSVTGQGDPWSVSAVEDQITTTSDVTKPVAVQLDGKDAVAVAFVQRAQGSGTQKAHGLVKFVWIDPTNGKKLVQVVVDLTPALGPDLGADEVIGLAADPATGQLAVGVSPNSEAAAKKAGDFTVYADPSTEKGTVIPDLRVAGLAGGVVAGVRGREQEGKMNLSAALIDAATGTVKKKTPIAMTYLTPAGAGSTKHAYLSGYRYLTPPAGKPFGNYARSLYAVDLTSGAVVETKFPVSPDKPADDHCWSDQQDSVVCHGRLSQTENTEIYGVDDTTGKKTWGYTTKSGSRVVPDVTAAYHGVVYAQAETEAVLLDAKTGQDIPTPSAAPSDGSTPSDTSSPTAADTATDGGSALDLLDGKVKSPTAVSPYGATYLQDARADDDYLTILVVLKAVA